LHGWPKAAAPMPSEGRRPNDSDPRSRSADHPRHSRGLGKLRPNGFAGIGGGTDAEAHIAFYFGAMYLLQLVEQIVADESAEKVALALDMLNAELEEFLKAHAFTTQ
jgi:hypothetical protein